MSLAKSNKLLILFVSMKNPLWSRLLALQGKRLQKKAEQYLHKEVMRVAPTTLSNWRGGGTVSEKKALDLFAAVLSSLNSARSASVPVNRPFGVPCWAPSSGCSSGCLAYCSGPSRAHC